MRPALWLIFFLIAFIANLVSIQLQNETLQLISKPLIILTLVIYFLSATRSFNNKLEKWVVAALLFSWLGDVLLMFQEKNAVFFLLGLSAFLIAHIFYIVFFHNIKTKEKISSRWWLLLPVAIYYAVLIAVLYPHLADMKIPVPVYGIVISFMLLLALHMLFIKNENAGLGMMLGALLFIASDSVLAFNKFYRSFESAGLIIMITYGLAQLFIVKGAVKYICKSKE
jgi:uncharacterized membrane protein YhhN